MCMSGPESAAFVVLGYSIFCSGILVQGYSFFVLGYGSRGTYDTLCSQHFWSRGTGFFILGYGSRGIAFLIFGYSSRDTAFFVLGYGISGPGMRHFWSRDAVFVIPGLRDFWIWGCKRLTYVAALLFLDSTSDVIVYMTQYN